MLLACLIVLFFITLSRLLCPSLFCKQPVLEGTECKLWDRGFFALFMGALVVRLLLAMVSEGFLSDMHCWISWGERMETYGAAAFYAPDYFCDYPPGYLYVLGLLSRFASVLNLPEDGLYFLFKLPGIFADMGLASIFFYLGTKHGNEKTAFLFCAVFLFCPAFLYNSALWGQIDSVVLLFLVLSGVLLLKKKYTLAGICYVLGVLIKPQALLVFPFYILALLSSKSARAILSSVFWSLLTFLMLCIPFSPAWQTESGLSLFLQLFNPSWIVEKYLTTLSSYPYFTVNAFNAYGLLGLNWVSTVGDFSAVFSVLNGVILILGLALSLVFFCKIKERPMAFLIGAYIFTGFLYTFAMKMHERYLLLPLGVLFFITLTGKSKRLFTSFLLQSSVCFINLYYVFLLADTTGKAPWYPIVALLSFAQVAFYLHSLYLVHREFVLCIPSSPEKVLSQKSLLSLEKNHAMTRTDALVLSVITLMYACVGFFQLGDTKAPQTYWQPDSVSDMVYITFSETENIQEIDYYCGVGEVSKSPSLMLSYSLDGEQWTFLNTPVATLKSVFYWESQPLDYPLEAKYIRLQPTHKDYMLMELGFRTADGSLATISSATSLGENATALFDEQALVTNLPTYKNSTYFDEIYHPRTAFEHLHLMPYYETTHPPLGKLMMAVGVWLFGMTPFGWRFSGTLMGVLMLPLFYLFLKRLFGRTRYAVLGTLLFAFDFMHFSLTRLATIDSYPVFFILGMYLFMYQFWQKLQCRAKGEKVSFGQLYLPLFLSGLCMGLGCASKWTAVYAAAGLAIEFVIIMTDGGLQYRKWGRKDFFKDLCRIDLACLLFFVIIPCGIYLLSYLPIAMVEGYGNVFEVMWENQGYMLNYHATLKGDHSYASPWYTWPFVVRPMWAYMAPETSVDMGQLGCISIFQNPILSWVGIVAFFYSLWVGIKEKDRRVLFLTIGLLSQYLPWALISRYALQYHFFATMVFLILFVVYAMADLEKRYLNARKINNCFVAVCLILFVLFYPVLSGVPSSRFYVETFLRWFDSWVFFL